MESSIPKNRILILEEQRIIAFDLGQQLTKRGYRVSYEKTFEDIQTSFLFGFSEIVISSLRSIRNSMNTTEPGFLSKADTCDFRTDTIIMDRGFGYVKCFGKPYRTEEIISFIHTLMINSKPTIKSKTINI